MAARGQENEGPCRLIPAGSELCFRSRAGDARIDCERSASTNATPVQARIRQDETVNRRITQVSVESAQCCGAARAPAEIHGMGFSRGEDIRDIERREEPEFLTSAGFDGALQKPFTGGELLEELDRVLSRVDREKVAVGEG